MTGIPGRMERIDLGQEFMAIVDFAHTPHALRQALIAARQLVNNNRQNRQDNLRIWLSWLAGSRQT